MFGLGMEWGEPVRNTQPIAKWMIKEGTNGQSTHTHMERVRGPRMKKEGGIDSKGRGNGIEMKRLK